MQNNPAECRICFSGLSTEGEHRPRTLACGHTFCSACIAYLLGKNGGRLTCPTCRVQHAARDATHFPINYGMEALIQQMQCQANQQGVPELGECQQEEAEDGDSLGSDVEAVKEWVVSLLPECSAVMTQLHQCQEQLLRPQAQHSAFLSHLCNLVAENKAAVTQLMQCQGRCRSLVEEGEGIVRNLQALVETLECGTSARERRAAIYLANRRVQEMEGWRKKHEVEAVDQALSNSTQVLEATQDALKQLGREGVGVSGSSDVPSTSHLSAVLQRAQHSLEHTPTLTTEDLRLMGTEVRGLLEGGSVFAVHLESPSSIRSSPLTLEDGQLHLYHLLDQPPPHSARTVQVTGYLCSPHTSLLAFLDLAWGGETRGRVYIRLHLSTPLARQFLMLCCGRQGHTYAGSSLLKVCGQHCAGEFLIGGDYTCDDGSGGPPLLEDLHGNYKKTGAAGSVWGRWEVEDQRAAQFAITTRDCKGSIPRVFGSVEQGLPLVRTAILALRTHRVTISECGVVVSL